MPLAGGVSRVALDRAEDDVEAELLVGGTGVNGHERGRRATGQREKVKAWLLTQAAARTLPRYLMVE